MMFRNLTQSEIFSFVPICWQWHITTWLQEVQEYFAHYIVKDRLGIVATAVTVFADKDPERAMNPACIELARLHSIAVDFAKSGVPAEIPKHLRMEEYPDFMEKTNKPKLPLK